MRALIVNSCVVRVVVRCEHAVFDERSDADRSKRFTETHAVVAFISSEASKVVRIPQGDLRTDSHPAGPLRAAVQVKDRSVSGVDQKRRLDRSYGASCPLAVVSRCLLAVEVGGIDRGVSVLVELLRRPAEQLSLHAHRCSLECLIQRRRRGKLPAPKTQ